MEESLREAPAVDPWREALAQTIEAQRTEDRRANRQPPRPPSGAGKPNHRPIDEISQGVATCEQQVREGASKLDLKEAGLDKHQTLLNGTEAA